MFDDYLSYRLITINHFSPSFSLHSDDKNNILCSLATHLPVSGVIFLKIYPSCLCVWSEQLEEEAGEKVRGEAQGGEEEPPGGEAEWALTQEREEHRRLLAQSHSESLDLRWRLQHGEKRWSRERAELQERYDRERQEWDGSMRELRRKMDRVRVAGTDPVLDQSLTKCEKHPEFKGELWLLL